MCRQMFRDIDADCYLMVDGDDTYPAEAAKALCEPILNGTADMTVGDRLSTAPTPRKTSVLSTALATIWSAP